MSERASRRSRSNSIGLSSPVSAVRIAFLCWAACAGAIATLLGCGGSGNDEATSPSTVEGLSARVDPALLQDPKGPLANLSDFQKEILGDGVLTLAEYERAILEVRRCMAALGSTPTRESMPTKNHGYSARWYNPGPGRETTEDEKRQNREQTARCFRDYTDALGSVWGRTYHASAEELQRARDAFAACIRDRGAGDLPIHPGDGEILNFIVSAAGAPEVRACRERIEEEFDMPSFAG